MTAMHDSRYLKGIEHFNRHEFFEAHDIWEELWREMKGDDSRKFFQGLIHAAVALHHYRNGNLAGAGRLWAYCVEHLNPFRPLCHNLDVDEFLGRMWEIMDAIYQAAPPPFDASRVPKIALIA